MTKAELDLRLKCYDYAESAGPIDVADPSAFNTERIPLLAARWSVDPASVGARMPGENRGIAGELSRSRNR